MGLVVPSEEGGAEELDLFIREDIVKYTIGWLGVMLGAPFRAHGGQEWE